MNRIEKSSKIIGLLICLAFMLFPMNSSTLQFTIFGILLLSIGIPHGAIDHLISNPRIDRHGLIKFLVIYLTLISAYLAFWYFFPVLSLVAFLLMSSYHFGQSHFLNDNPTNPYSAILFTSRGGYYLFSILLGDWELTKQILSPLLDLEFIDQSRLAILFGFLIFTLLFQLFFGPKLNSNNLLELLILGPILYLSPLLIGFIIYFGFWHALPSMLAEYNFLKSYEAYNSFKKFAFQLLPFSLISFAGIGLSLILGMKYLNNSELILVFFVMISLISFPHILYMDRFLRSKNQN